MQTINNFFVIFEKTEIEITDQLFSKYIKDDKVQILYLPGDESKAILKEDATCK